MLHVYLLLLLLLLLYNGITSPRPMSPTVAITRSSSSDSVMMSSWNICTKIKITLRINKLFIIKFLYYSVLIAQYLSILVTRLMLQADCCSPSPPSAAQSKLEMPMPAPMMPFCCLLLWCSYSSSWRMLDRCEHVIEAETVRWRMTAGFDGLDSSFYTRL